MDKLKLSEVLWHDDYIEWHASDLYECGYISNQDEWENFAKVMNDVAMEYFSEKAHEQDMFNLERFAIDLENYEFPELMDARDFPHGEV